MLIINADDWGGAVSDTDAALACYKEGRITSVSAMVYMEDSSRAANLAKEAGIDVGLHLNFDQRFSGEGYKRYEFLEEYHDRIITFLKFNKYAFLIYNPVLRKQFQYVFRAQYDEFLRLYEKEPSHINGHHHMHLCSNMLFDEIIPKHQKVRRNFTFRPGQKNIFNIMYRSLVDRRLSRRYFLTDYFFSLSQIINDKKLLHVVDLSKKSCVEIMTHPIVEKEYIYLMSDDYLSMVNNVEKGTYSNL